MQHTCEHCGAISGLEECEYGCPSWDVYEDGAAYWVSYPDGSRIKMTARYDSDGICDLFASDEVDAAMWQVSTGPLPPGITVAKIEKEMNA